MPPIDRKMRARVAVRALLALTSWLMPYSDVQASSSLVTLTGRLNVTSVDDFSAGKSSLRYTLIDADTGRVVELLFDKSPGPPELRTGMDVEATGTMQSATVLVVQMIHVLRVSPANALTDSESATAALSGERRILVLLVNFIDASVDCFDAVRSLMFAPTNSVAWTYGLASYGQLSISGDTFGPLQIPYTFLGSCTPEAWSTVADSVFSLHGVDVRSYDHRVYVFPSGGTGQCGGKTAGLGQLGGTLSWINGCQPGDVFVHELGHNFGMRHAAVLGEEYGDRSCSMGYGAVGYRGFNSPHVEQMGWLPPQKIVEANGNMLLELAPLELLPSQTTHPMVVKVALPAAQGFEYLAYRRLVGVDAAMRAQYGERTSIHYYAPGSGAPTLLEATLDDGSQFQSEYTAAVVTQLAHDQQSAILEVAFSCERYAPAVTVSRAPAKGMPGAVSKYVLKVADEDNSKCASTTFGLDVEVPAGWTATQLQSSVDVAPHGEGSFTVDVGSPATTLNGSYPLSFRVRRDSAPDVIARVDWTHIIEKPVDYAFIAIKGPKRLKLAAVGSAAQGSVSVVIQNRGPQTENITDLVTLQNLVDLSVTSLGTCAAPVPQLTSRPKFPVALKPKKKLALKYAVPFTCINDPLKTTKDAGHDDYRYEATVHHEVVDGNMDVHPADDRCPRPPSGDDKGCGARGPDRLVGAPVVTDLVPK